MKVLVSGHLGYIGAALVPRMLAAGFDVTGLDSDLYRDCTYGTAPIDVPVIPVDIRDLEKGALQGFDAVVHLAGLSNDPLGELNTGVTDAINHRATTRLATMAKSAGVTRFVFSSSCSTYGAAGEDFVTENADFNPVTAYGRSKVLAERDLASLADDQFSPVYLRNATVYGYSPRMRFDLVINNLAAWAYTTGRVHLKSQGLAWRPLVHVEDVADAFVAALQAPAASVHNEAFNIGSTSENYRVRELAEMVASQLPSAVVEMAEGAEADTRTYRVNCDKVISALSWQPKWSVEQGITSVLESYRRFGLCLADFEGHRYQRVAHLLDCLARGTLAADLRRTGAA